MQISSYFPLIIFFFPKTEKKNNFLLLISQLTQARIYASLIASFSFLFSSS